MNNLEVESRMTVACLVRDIIQNNPPITHLSLDHISEDKDRDESAGEIIL